MGNKQVRIFGMTILALALVLVACASKQKSLEQAEIFYKMALGLDSKGESTQALAQALKAEKLDPKNAEVQNLLGLLFMRNKVYERAEKNFKKAVSIDGEYSEARTNLSYLYIETNRFDEAIKEGMRAVENITYLTPEVAYNNIGWAYYKKGDVENAVSYLNRALLHNKGYFQPHWNLAKIYFDAGNFKDAKKEYEASIESCKECSFLYYDLGMTLLKLKDKRGAVKVFEACKKIQKQGDEFIEKCAQKLAALK